MTKYSFTREEIESAAKEADSRTAMMRILKIKQGGGGYQALDFWCKKYDIEPPTYKPNYSKIIKSAMPDDEWFVDGIRRQGQLSRKRLVSSGVPDVCCECGQGPVWNGKPLVLQLDHIDGNRWNNTRENLRILCPHCHTQTETYANTGARKARFYCECGKEICKGSTKCNPCATKDNIKVDWPSVDEVIEQVRLTNFTATGRLYNCTDNTVRRFLERNGVDWRKL